MVLAVVLLGSSGAIAPAGAAADPTPGTCTPADPTTWSGCAPEEAPACDPTLAWAGCPSAPPALPAPAIPDEPPPAPLADGTPAEQAAALSSMLDGAPDGWLPAVMRVFQLSGYAIIEADGRFVGLPPVEPTPTVDAWELWLLAGFQDGAAVRLSDWADMMRDALEAGITDAGFADGTQIDAADLADTILADIADGVRSDDPSRAFLTSFIALRAATLGADPSRPGVSPADVWLDPVSYELLSRAVAGDVILDALPGAIAYQAAQAGTGPIAGIASASGPVRLTVAAVKAPPLRPTGVLPTQDQVDDRFYQECVPTSRIGKDQQDRIKLLIKLYYKGQSIVPSELSKDWTQSKIKLPGMIDLVQNLHAGMATDEAAKDVLKARYDVATKVGLPLFEALVDTGKLVAYQKGIRAEASIDKVPLTRTYDGGQRGTITVKLSFDPKGEEYVYCMDFFVQALGANLTLPAAGPLDAPTQLVPLNGFDHLDLDRSDIWRKAVKPVGGVVTAGVTGKTGDPSTVDPKRPQPFDFGIRVDLALKDSSIGKDLWDAYKTVAAGLGSGIVKAISNALQRQTLFGMRSQHFEGRDFGPRGPWHGTVTVDYSASTQHSSTIRYPDGSSIASSDREATEITDVFEVSGKEVLGSVSGLPTDKVNIQMEGRQSMTGGYVSDQKTYKIGKGAYTDPGHPKRTIGCDFRDSDVRHANGTWQLTGAASVQVTLGADGSYDVAILRSAENRATVPWTEDWKYVPIRGLDCGLPTSSTVENTLSPIASAVSYLPPGPIKGRYDPHGRTNSLSGSVKYPLADGSLVTVTWELMHEGPIKLP